jgi:uncharacterized membrane protein YkvA (DUF1232 family)
MNNQQAGKPSNPLGFLTEAINTGRLVWRLVQDPRIPIAFKLVPAVTLLYVISPIDLIPDIIPGLGQLDDIAAILLGMNWFVQLCPPAIVAEHRRALFGADPNEEVVDAEYRVVGDQSKP